jgi:glucose-6-phosphate 1-dehydrogenase
MRSEGMEPENRPEPMVAQCDVAGSATELLPGAASNPPESSTLVVFGASGDLTARKLIPALYNLYRTCALPERFRIVGCGRTVMDQDEFRARLRESLAPDGPLETSQWEGLASLIHYHRVDYGDGASFEGLAAYLNRLDEEAKTGANKIFYLAIPPMFYEPVARNLHQAGLNRENQGGHGWSRIVVEKPFGRDLESAITLDRSLRKSFQEHQIYRIDHYLAKETVQNILIFRFANSIFEPIWNRRYIKSVSITAAETLGVENRAGYYDQAGVLRDMFQNHMMQLLALTAMEAPPRFETEWVRDEKAKVFKALRPFPVDALYDHLVNGQYGPGVIDGRQVPGYVEEPRVRPDSLTPTFAAMKVFVDNWRWQGVPFFLTSGKRLAAKVSEITIQFREVPHSIFRNVFPEEIRANRLTLGIHPEERISLTFQTKNPGAVLQLRPVTMDFLYRRGYTGPVLDAYEKVLIDTMRGDQMLFVRQDAVELNWAFLSPVLDRCESCGRRDQMLFHYPAGSWGPKEASGFRDAEEADDRRLGYR